MAYHPTHLVPVQQDCCVLGDPRDDLAIRIELVAPLGFERTFQDTDHALRGLDLPFHDVGRRGANR